MTSANAESLRELHFNEGLVFKLSHDTTEKSTHITLSQISGDAEQLKKSKPFLSTQRSDNWTVKISTELGQKLLKLRPGEKLESGELTFGPLNSKESLDKFALGYCYRVVWDFEWRKEDGYWKKVPSIGNAGYLLQASSADFNSNDDAARGRAKLLGLGETKLKWEPASLFNSAGLVDRGYIREEKKKNSGGFHHSGGKKNESWGRKGGSDPGTGKTGQGEKGKSKNAAGGKDGSNSKASKGKRRGRSPSPGSKGKTSNGKGKKISGGKGDRASKQ